VQNDLLDRLIMIMVLCIFVEAKIRLPGESTGHFRRKVGQGLDLQE